MLELTLEILISEHMSLYESFFVHHPSLDCIVFDNLAGPLAELDRTRIVDFETHSNDCLEIVVVNSTVFVDSTFLLNY